MPGDWRAESHHPLSHHGDNPEGRAHGQINAFHVSLFAEYLAKLKDTPEGNGSLLDNMLILYDGIGNPNVHDHTNLPIILAGGAAGGMGNRHIGTTTPRRWPTSTSRCSTRSA